MLPISNQQRAPRPGVLVNRPWKRPEGTSGSCMRSCSCVVCSQSTAPLGAAFALKSGTDTEASPTSVVLIMRALVVGASWARRSRRSTLEQMTAAAEASRIAELQTPVVTPEDTLELQEPHISVLESPPGRGGSGECPPASWIAQAYHHRPRRRLRQRGVQGSSQPMRCQGAYRRGWQTWLHRRH
jgi:hypothetical protein